MGYLALGPRSCQAAADTTGLNTGNLTNAFTTNIVAINVANFEMYHAVITNITPGSQATVRIGTALYSSTSPQGGSEYDPAQPMLLWPSQEIYFLWNIAASTTPVPMITCYFRYDPLLPGNNT
jgi:hypothetical protein